MYEELVKRLRAVANADHADKCDGCPYDEDYPCCVDCLDTMLKQAAEAIEELSRMERDFRQYISDQVKREKGVYACCYCKNRESANKYESECSLDECDGVSGWAWGVPKEET